MSTTDILYKVIALYLLDSAAAPLSNSAICEFFVNGNYTDYFNACYIINNLGESGLIDTKGTNNVTIHSINERGKSTLMALSDRLGTDIKNEVESYLRLNAHDLKKQRELYSDYDKNGFGGFVVHLRATDNEKPVIDLSINVGSEVVAKSICTNWKNNFEKVYELIMDELV